MYGEWRTSSFCNTGPCVLVGSDHDWVAIRDAIDVDRASQASFAFTANDWGAFAQGTVSATSTICHGFGCLRPLVDGLRLGLVLAGTANGVAQLVRGR
ncbi:MAG: DUF397 domain-containing protein [Acidimicrobiales bacterium]